jgi:hypothetical protein
LEELDATWPEKAVAADLVAVFECSIGSQEVIHPRNRHCSLLPLVVLKTAYRNRSVNSEQKVAARKIGRVLRFNAKLNDSNTPSTTLVENGTSPNV